MDIISKENEPRARKIAGIIYITFLVGYGIYGSQFGFYSGMTKQAQPTIFFGSTALFMLWGTLSLLALLAGFVFEERKNKLYWMIVCIILSGVFYGLAFIEILSLENNPVN